MYTQENILNERLTAHSDTFHPVVKFNPSKDKLLHINLTNNNKELLNFDITDTITFSDYVNAVLKKAKARFGVGGYNELRHLYERSNVFDNAYGDEPRRLHLGIDIWGDEGTKVYAPLGGMVHSYGYNNNFGDYGATIILLHQLDTITFYTLYGHLSNDDLARVTEAQYVIRGQVIGHFGNPQENGNWPPHLHFQIIKDIGEYKGDYPGVCKFSERKKFLDNSPDPDLILNMRQYSID